MKHWIRFLPNVGDAFLARAKELEDLSAKIVKATRRREEVERDVWHSAHGDWTEDEIRAAHVDAVRANAPPPAPGIVAEGQDAQRLGAKPEEPDPRSGGAQPTLPHA